MFVYKTNLLSHETPNFQKKKITSGEVLKNLFAYSVFPSSLEKE